MPEIRCGERGKRGREGMKHDPMSWTLDWQAEEKGKKKKRKNLHVRKRKQKRDKNVEKRRRNELTNIFQMLLAMSLQLWNVILLFRWCLSNFVLHFLFWNFWPGGRRRRRGRRRLNPPLLLHPKTEANEAQSSKEKGRERRWEMMPLRKGEERRRRKINFCLMMYVAPFALEQKEIVLAVAATTTTKFLFRIWCAIASRTYIFSFVGCCCFFCT